MILPVFNDTVDGSNDRYLLFQYLFISFDLPKIRHLQNYEIDTVKKDKKSFPIYKEIQKGSGCKRRKGFLIYEEMRKYLVVHIWEGH